MVSDDENAFIGACCRVLGRLAGWSFVNGYAAIVASCLKSADRVTGAVGTAGQFAARRVDETHREPRVEDIGNHQKVEPTTAMTSVVEEREIAGAWGINLPGI